MSKMLIVVHQYALEILVESSYIMADLIYREPDSVCISIKVEGTSHPTKHSESEADTLNSDYERVDTDRVQLPTTPHAIHTAPGSALYEQVQ